ncbi:MAG: TnpV protein [Oscillospiraceae bacterium]|nr:TnpV protein [Oscillospiraceae bacterium]
MFISAGESVQLCRFRCPEKTEYSFGGTYTLGNDGMLYPDLVIGDKEQRPIGKWGRMHMKYLEVGRTPGAV